MNQLLVLQAEHEGIKSTADAVKYCYQKIIIEQECRERYLEDLGHLFKEETPKRFLNTFKQLRAFSYGRSNWSWLEISEDSLQQLSFKPSAIFWSGLTCHPNGYIREFALTKLIEENEEVPLRFLLMMLNDHLDFLRERASKVICEKNRFISEQELIFCLPLIDQLKQLTYEENRIIYNQLQKSVLERPQLLMNGQQNFDIFCARTAFKWSFLLDDSYRKQTLENGLASKDRIILVWTFREIQKEPSWEERSLDELLNHHSLIIRKLACEWCYNNRLKDRRMIAKLLDQTTAIKELALAYVRKHFPEVDCRAYYLEQMNTQLNTSVHGLALLQDRRDQEQMLSLRHAKQKKIRLSVLNWSVCLPLEEQLSLAVDYVSDSSREVRKKAIERLSQNYSLAIKERLLPMFQEKQELPTQLSIIKILAAENRRDYFFDLIILYKEAAAKQVKNQIEKQLEDWCTDWNQRFFFRFSLKDKVELAYLLNKNHVHYSGNLVNLILTVIKSK